MLFGFRTLIFRGFRGYSYIFYQYFDIFENIAPEYFILVTLKGLSTTGLPCKIWWVMSANMFCNLVMSFEL